MAKSVIRPKNNAAYLKVFNAKNYTKHKQVINIEIDKKGNYKIRPPLVRCPNFMVPKKKIKKKIIKSALKIIYMLENKI